MLARLNSFSHLFVFCMPPRENYCVNFLNLPLVKQIYCRKQKLEKPQMDAKCKRLSSLIKENAKRRMEFLEKESSLV